MAQNNPNFASWGCFGGQKKAFFWKVHFIHKWSVTQNTVYQWLKNNFLLSHPKLVFFTRFYLVISKSLNKVTTIHRRSWVFFELQGATISHGIYGIWDNTILPLLGSSTGIQQSAPDGYFRTEDCRKFSNFICEINNNALFSEPPAGKHSIVLWLHLYT